MISGPSDPPLGKQGDLAGALQHFERAMALRPGYADARRNYEMTRTVLEAQRRRAP